jgi:hypothetical protein
MLHVLNAYSKKKKSIWISVVLILELEAAGLCELESLILPRETENWRVSVLCTKHNVNGEAA